MVVLGSLWQDVIFGETSRRAGGFLLFGPIVFGGFGIYTLIRAGRALKPWYDYRAVTDLDQRRMDKAADLDGQARWPLIFFGTLSLAGWVSLLLVRARNEIGVIGLSQLQVLAFLVWTAALGLLAQSIYYRRFRAAKESGVGDDDGNQHRRDNL